MNCGKLRRMRTFVRAVKFIAVAGMLGCAFPAAAEQPRAPARDEEHRFRRHVKSWTELRRRNVVMQQRDYSCGAAALATLIRFHLGDPVTETRVLQETVRLLTTQQILDRTRNGLSMTDLRRVAVQMGYLSTIGRLEFDKLSQSKVPVVVGIEANNFEHFVVYRGTDGRYVYLADPALGNVRTPIDEFQQQWQENAVLVVVKRDEQKKTDSQLQVSREEKSLGELNLQYLREQTTTMRHVLTGPR